MVQPLDTTQVPAPGPEPGAKVLIVDDRTENLTALEAVLQPLGANVVRAESGLEALRWLLKEEFAVVLLDAQMPGMDGFETAEFIRNRPRTRHLPIIFVTAYDKDEHQVFQGYSVGAVDYITKPFDPEILRSKVRVFVELYKRGEEIKRQQELLRQIELREAERRREEQARELEKEHMRRLNQELELRVQERTAQLVAANKELEAFCYSVSHDLRAPLRAIAGTSRMLIEDAAERLEEEDVKSLMRQAAAATRLGILIDDLLLLSRIGRRALARKEVDLSKLAHEVTDEIMARGWANPPRVEIEEGLRTQADPGLARVLVQNLIDNAVKYSPEGGVVTLGKDGEAFFVRDQGIGFDMKYAPKVFLPFERLHLDSEFPGTGIGLASVERIVRRHGGTVWVESEPGRGSSFYFSFEPIARPPEAVELPRPGIPELPPSTPLPSAPASLV